jgi:hypothetical protein
LSDKKSKTSRDKNEDEITEELLQSVLRRWKSKVQKSRQALADHEEAFIDYAHLQGLWTSIAGRALEEIGKLPEAIAVNTADLDDIPRVSEIIRSEVHSALNRLATGNNDQFISGVPEEIEEKEIDAPPGTLTSDLILIERTRQNHLVAELNERQSLIAAGALMNAQAVEAAMCNMVGIARTKLLALANGFARLITAQSYQAVIATLAEEIGLVIAELKPEVPTEADVTAAADVSETDEDEDAEDN